MMSRVASSTDPIPMLIFCSFIACLRVPWPHHLGNLPLKFRCPQTDKTPHSHPSAGGSPLALLVVVPHQAGPIGEAIVESILEAIWRMLSSLHGIGFIRLDADNAAESQVMIPAKERSEVDWHTAKSKRIKIRLSGRVEL
jgi:hypothetical protein